MYFIRSISIAKKRYPLKTLIGTRFGKMWQATRAKTFLPLQDDLDSVLFKVPSGSSFSSLSLLMPCVDGTTMADNRTLLDDSTNQKLSQEEILEMQRKGVEGQDIIKALIDNSASFQNKTEFSQAKYIKKKQQKYVLLLSMCALFNV